MRIDGSNDFQAVYMLGQKPESRFLWGKGRKKSLLSKLFLSILFLLLFHFIFNISSWDHLSINIWEKWETKLVVSFPCVLPFPWPLESVWSPTISVMENLRLLFSSWFPCSFGSGLEWKKRGTWHTKLADLDKRVDNQRVHLNRILIILARF